MACCDGSNDQGNRNQKKKDQKEKYDPLRRVNHGMTQTVDYVATVLTDTALLSIVSDFYNPALVRILTLKSAWLRAHIVFVHRHRNAASLKLLGHDGDWSETVQLAARREYDVRSTWESSTQVGSIPSKGTGKPKRKEGIDLDLQGKKCCQRNVRARTR